MPTLIIIMGSSLFFKLTFISPILLIVGIFFCLYYRKHLSGCFRLFWAYFTIGLITEILSRYFGFYSNLKYNLFLIPFYGLSELIIFTSIYYKYLFKRKNKKLLYFTYVLITLIILELTRFRHMFQAYNFQSYSKVIADIGIVCFGLIYYWDVIKGKVRFSSEINILNAANLSFFSMNLLLFLFINFLVNENYKLVMIFWTFNLIIISLYYTTLILLIWQNGKTRKSLH